MKLIPKFLRGNYSVGPNGFTKHDGYDPIKNMWSIYWFSGYGLEICLLVNGKKSCRVKFQRLAKFLLRCKLKWS